jgi:hypothetical protein
MARTVGLLRWQTLFKVTLLIGLIVAGNYLTHAITGALNFDIRPSNEDAVHRSIIIAATLYSILLAIPFVPGAEIGLALMAMLGPPIAMLVYLCTLAGLTVGYTVGRLVPLAVLIAFMERAGMTRAAAFLKSIENLDGQQRLQVLMERAPNRFLPFLLRHRYLSLAVALNLPGNFIVGGGGGIALFAGISRLFSVPAFILTVALAVSPVPLAVFFLGRHVLPS